MSTATELLRRALEAWDLMARSGEAAKTFEEIRAFLVAEPEAEPVFIQPDHLQKARIAPFLCRVEPKQRDDFAPLYTRPESSRKPMTEEEIWNCIKGSNLYCKVSFVCGVQAAEEHHGISGEDQ